MWQKKKRARDCTCSRGQHGGSPGQDLALNNSQPSALRAHYPHNWFLYPGICKEGGTYPDLCCKTEHLLVLSLDAKEEMQADRFCPSDFHNKGTKDWRGAGVRGSSQPPAEVALGTIWHPDVSELQGRCLSRVKRELALVFDVSPECPYVMTLTQSNYLFSGLGGALFFSFSLLHHKEKYNNILMKVEQTSSEESEWSLTRFHMNIQVAYKRVWTSKSPR